MSLPHLTSSVRLSSNALLHGYTGHNNSRTMAGRRGIIHHCVEEFDISRKGSFCKDYIVVVYLSAISIYSYNYITRKVKQFTCGFCFLIVNLYYLCGDVGVWERGGASQTLM